MSKFRVGYFTLNSQESTGAEVNWGTTDMGPVCVLANPVPLSLLGVETDATVMVDQQSKFRGANKFVVYQCVVHNITYDPLAFNLEGGVF